jgi:chromosomal replication initiator protein
MANSTIEHLTAHWDAISGRLRGEVGEAAYQSWLKPMVVRGLVDGAVEIAVPTRFMRDWVVAHYAERLIDLWQNENDDVKGVEIIVRPERAKAPKPEVAKRDDNANLIKPTVAAESAEQLSAPLDPRFSFDNFVVGKPNEFAYAAARRMAEATHVSFNPLFLYGGVGLGKTHLMHAIAWSIRSRDPQRTVIYCRQKNSCIGSFGRCVNTTRSISRINFAPSMF